MRFVRHQRIHFTIGQANVRFIIKEKKERQLTEGIPPAPRLEKPPKVQKPSITVRERSLAACYELIQSLKQRRSLEPLFTLIGSALDTEHSYSEQAPGISDLGGLDRKVVNGEYETVDEFIRDLDDFFDSVKQIFGQSSDVGRSADRFGREIGRAFAHIGKSGSTKGFENLRSKLEKFTSVQVGEIGEQPVKVDFVGLTQKLNALPEAKRRQAEWIIRIHCPTLPYYENGVDVTALPHPAVTSLQALIG
jgi:hypothetical protein